MSVRKLVLFINSTQASMDIILSNGLQWLLVFCSVPALTAAKHSLVCLDSIQHTRNYAESTSEIA